MAFGDSTEKDVRILLSTEGADQVKSDLDEIADKIRRLKADSANLRVTLSDPGLDEKLDDIRQKMRDLDTDQAVIGVHVEGFDDALAKLTTLKELKDRLSGNADIRVTTSGAGVGAAKMAAEGAAADAEEGTGAFTKLAGFFGMGEQPTSLLGAGSILGVLTSPGGGLALASLLPVIGALGAYLGGAGIGGLGLFGAYKMGSTAYTQQTAYQTAIANAQKSIKGGAYGTTYTQDVKTIIDDKAALAHLEKIDGGVIKIYTDLQAVGKEAKSIFEGAITGGGGNSFANQMGKILKQLKPDLENLAKPLQQLFQASAPYIDAVIKSFDGLAKTVIPAMTTALKQFEPHLPGLIRSFQVVSDIVGSLIQFFARLAGVMADTVSGAIYVVMGAVHDFQKIVEAAKGPVTGVFQVIAGSIGIVVDSIKDLVHWGEEAWSWLSKLGGISGGGVTSRIWHALGLAGGGIIPGYAPGRDIVPAMLSPGESVLTPEATRFLGPGNITALNAASGRSSGVSGGLLRAAGGFLGGGSGFGGMFGGGMNVIINFNGVVTNPDATAREVQQMLLTLKRHNGYAEMGLD